MNIITISKDDPAGLTRTLASIAGQSVTPHQVILVRAGRSREPQIEPQPLGNVLEIPDPGRGIAAAFNAAVAACSPGWLVFLNGGDEFLNRDSLARLRTACAAADADIVTCMAQTDAGTTLPRRDPKRPCDFLYIAHQASAFRRSLFAEVGPYSESFRIRMDLDWMARYLLVHGTRRILFLPEPVVRYRLDGISSTSMVDFHLEELRVLCRSWSFLPAMADFAFRRTPGRLVRAALSAQRFRRTGLS